MRCCILGSGMSGLVAANALYDMGIDFDIYDACVSNVSQQKGLHYLHGNCGIKELTAYRLRNFIVEPPGIIPRNARYSKKVWGNTSVLNNSMVDLPQETIVYNFRYAFEILKSKFKNNIYEQIITRDFVRSCQNEYDLVISTIPLKILFPDVKCEEELVFAKEGLPENMTQLELNDFTVVYNLYNEVPWYRISKVFSQIYTEYVPKYTGEYGLVPIKKIKTQTELNLTEVLYNNHILMVGRFAEWDRKRLVNQIYDIVKEDVQLWKQFGRTNCSLIQ